MPALHDDEFLRHVSHELRNPLSPLRHGLQLLRRLPTADAGAAPLLELMERQINRLLQLADELDAHRLGATTPPAAAPAPAQSAAAAPQAAAPQAAPSPAAAPAPAAESAAARLSAWERILVVDDNADAAAGLAALLRSMGPDVQVASDGREALRLAERFHPQLVFMDIVMPPPDGLLTARALRTRPWAGNIIICALTGSGDPHLQAGSSLAGIDYHLVKPVDTRVLTALMGDSD